MRRVRVKEFVCIEKRRLFLLSHTNTSALLFVKRPPFVPHGRLLQATNQAAGFMRELNVVVCNQVGTPMRLFFVISVCSSG